MKWENSVCFPQEYCSTSINNIYSYNKIIFIIMSIQKSTLLMLGDSLVEWGDWSERLPEFTVKNRGMAGETVEELAGRIFMELGENEGCDHILIMSGTNNILMGDTLFPAIFSTMLPRMQMLAPDAQISVNALFPMPAVPIQDIRQVNGELASICGQAHCSFLDVTAEVTTLCRPITHPCFHPDGVHLTNRGYTVWADVLNRHLRSTTRPDEG